MFFLLSLFFVHSLYICRCLASCHCYYFIIIVIIISILIYYLLILKNYVSTLISYESTKLVPRVRSTRRGALCEAKNLPLILSEAIKLKNRLIARVGKRVLEESKKLSETGQNLFYVQNCLSVVQKCPEVRFNSAQKCCSKVPASVV